MSTTDDEKPVLNYAVPKGLTQTTNPLNAGQRAGLGCLTSVALSMGFAFLADMLPWSFTELLLTFPMSIVAWLLKDARRGTQEFSTVLTANAIFWGYLIALTIRRRVKNQVKD